MAHPRGLMTKAEYASRPVVQIGGKGISGALAYKVRGDGFVEVYDLDFAAYCLKEGVTIADMVEEGPKRRGKPPRYLFLFCDEGGDRIRKLSVAFTNSEEAKFAYCVRRLKKSIRSTYPREG